MPTGQNRSDAHKVALMPGLYFVATPLGAARDITLRALDILASADVLAAEDTRTLRRLMDIHGIALGQRPLLAYHDHNGAGMRPKLLRLLAEGKSVAYSSEAGTPLVADPGYALGRDALEAGHKVTSAPGPVAAIAALTVSGLPSDRFTFAGFPPAAKAARARFFRELAEISGTILLYESPKRVSRMLRECVLEMGGDREVAVCRELTKRFEEVVRGKLADVADQFETRSVKGEVVVCIGRAPDRTADIDLDAELRDALTRLSRKDAAREVAARHGLARRDVYQAALALKSGGDDEQE